MGAPHVDPSAAVSASGHRGGWPGGGGERHAGHYLASGIQSSALQTTLEHAARALGFPLGFVSIVNATARHVLAGTTGSTGAAVAGLLRADLPCDEVVSGARLVAITDLDEEPDEGASRSTRSRAPGGYPNLSAAGVRAYLGLPLHGREGSVVGSLCFMDTQPHAVTRAQTTLLRAQAEVVEDHLDLHRRRSDLHLPDQPGVAGGHRPVAREASGGMAGAAADLRRGLAAGEVVAHYEAIVDLGSGEVHGFEALARWQHPRRGLLSPASFIPLAEDSDLILDLDLAVLDQAAHQLRRWQEHHPRLRMNVNLSGRHLAHEECVERICGVVRRAGVEPSSIGLEITESALIALTTRATSFVADLRAHGFAILFDDFGTGWASLSYLLQLPADAVKIDRSFTAALTTRSGEAVVRALLSLTRDLGLETVVEGVASPADAQRVAQLGCRLAQGYLYGAAAPVAAVTW